MSWNWLTCRTSRSRNDDRKLCIDILFQHFTAVHMPIVWILEHHEFLPEVCCCSFLVVGNECCFLTLSHGSTVAT